jgi:hypothetical protein
MSKLSEIPIFATHIWQEASFEASQRGSSDLPSKVLGAGNNNRHSKAIVVCGLILYKRGR